MAHAHLLETATGRRLELFHGFKIGRVKGDHLLADDERVSGKHCEFLFDGENVFLRDFGSCNGTAVNGIAISGKTLLQSGDTITVGDTNFTFGTPRAERPAPRLVKESNPAPSVFSPSPKPQLFSAPKNRPGANKRVFAFLLDVLAYKILAAVLFFVAKAATRSELFDFSGIFTVPGVTFLLFRDALFPEGSPGKVIAGLYLDGPGKSIPARIKNSLTRNSPFLISLLFVLSAGLLPITYDGIPIFLAFLIPVIEYIAATRAKDGRRAGDTLAATMVVDKNSGESGLKYFVLCAVVIFGMSAVSALSPAPELKHSYAYTQADKQGELYYLYLMRSDKYEPSMNIAVKKTPFMLGLDEALHDWLSFSTTQMVCVVPGSSVLPGCSQFVRDRSLVTLTRNFKNLQPTNESERRLVENRIAFIQVSFERYSAAFRARSEGRKFTEAESAVLSRKEDVLLAEEAKLVRALGGHELKFEEPKSEAKPASP